MNADIKDIPPCTLVFEHAECPRLPSQFCNLATMTCHDFLLTCRDTEPQYTLSNSTSDLSNNNNTGHHAKNKIGGVTVLVDVITAGNRILRLMKRKILTVEDVRSGCIQVSIKNILPNQTRDTPWLRASELNLNSLFARSFLRHDVPIQESACDRRDFWDRRSFGCKADQGREEGHC